MQGAQETIEPIVREGVTIIKRLYELPDFERAPDKLARALDQRVDRPLLHHNAVGALHTDRMLVFPYRGTKNAQAFIQNVSKNWLNMGSHRNVDARNILEPGESAASLTTVSFSEALSLNEIQQFAASEAAYLLRLNEAGRPLHIFPEEQQAVHFEQQTRVIVAQGPPRTLSSDVVICMTDRKKLKVFAAACAYGVIRREIVNPEDPLPSYEVYLFLPEESGLVRRQLSHSELIKVPAGQKVSVGRQYLDALQQFCIVKTERVGVSENITSPIVKNIQRALNRDPNVKSRPDEQLTPFSLRLEDVEAAIASAKVGFGPAFSEEPDPQKKAQRNAENCLQAIIDFKRRYIDLWLEDEDIQVQDLGILMSLLFHDNIAWPLRDIAGENASSDISSLLSIRLPQQDTYSDKEKDFAFPLTFDAEPSHQPDLRTKDIDALLNYIELTYGNLLDFPVDAIVHSTNSMLAFGAAIGQQLIKRLGSERFQTLRQKTPIELGQAVVSNASPLPAHYIIHVPIGDLDWESPQTVAKAVLAALSKADSLEEVTTIAFPAIGSGTAGLDPCMVAPEVLGAIANYLAERGTSNLTKVFFVFYSEDTYDAYFETYNNLTGNQSPRNKLAYRLFFVNEIPKEVVVGQRLHMKLKLLPVTSDNNGFELPSRIHELYCFISGEGLSFDEGEVTSFVFDPKTYKSSSIDFDFQPQLVGERPYTIELFAEDPESGHISIYKTSGTITVLPPQAVEEHTPILPPLDIRVAPQPDFVLNVETVLPEGESGPRHLTYYLSSRLPGLHLRNEKVGEVTLRAADLTRLRALLQTTLQQTADCQTEDAHKCMRSLGTYLFDHLFPAETAADFREALWQAEGRLMTWLVREDGHTWLPWELFVPYRAEDNAPLQCLGERYQLSHWIEGLGPPLYNEVPLGEIALAHYNISEESAADQDEALSAWHKLLQAPDVRGILPVIKPETPFYGVHLLRWSESLTSRRDIVAREASTLPGSIERDTEQGRLHLRLKRPVVTLSILSGESAITNMNYDDWLLPDRVLPFLRAGASAVVGPWWPTSEAADRIFWPMFYDLLARRLPLGEVVWRARLAVRQALPDRLDWMAYTLFGDPRARAYWPETSEGYTVLECLNPDDPLRPGTTYTFRASLRSRPPVWYTDRLVQSETLPQDLRALFLAPGLQHEVTEPVPMTPVGRTMIQATIDLTLPEPGDYPLLAQLLEGDEHIKTLQLMLKVRDESTEKATHA